MPRLLPRGLFVTNETEVVQATYYCTPPSTSPPHALAPQAPPRTGLTRADNYHVFPEYSVHQLTPSVFVIPLPLEALKGASPAIIHILVSVAVRHRIYRVASNRRADDKGGLIELRSKYYHHRDKAITALNDEIYSYKNAYMLMISALLFVFAEVRSRGHPSGSRPPSLGWRVGGCYANSRWSRGWLILSGGCSSSSLARRLGRCIWTP